MTKSLVSGRGSARRAKLKSVATVLIPYGTKLGSHIVAQCAATYGAMKVSIDITFFGFRLFFNKVEPAVEAKPVEHDAVNGSFTEANNYFGYQPYQGEL